MSAPTGILQLVLKRAKDLKDVDFLGKQDPYCTLSVNTSAGPVSRRSKTHTDGGKDPVWDEVHEFQNVKADEVLKVQVFDENMVLRDVSIGECSLALTQYAGAGPRDVTLAVKTKKGKERGELHLTVDFKVAAFKAKDTTSKVSWILPTYANTDCWKDYEPGTILGKGTFGTTYLATHKQSGEKVAVKVISKRKLSSAEEIEDVRREVQIMHHLAGHPNVVCLKNVYEDKANVCLAMEVCTGGELFDAIVKRGSYSEKDAAAMMRTIIGVVAHCHNMGVIHRDLKPENFLLLEKSETSALKSTDFGLSSFFQEGQIFTDIVGSAYYVAPEVLKRSYGKEVDIWSCGVILYILLCGYPPFHGDNEKRIFEAVMSRPLDFQSEPWPKITEPAKDCIRKMLQRDPSRRATAQDILLHPWMREDGVASSAAMEMEVLTRIRKFSAGNRLRKEAVKVIAASLPPDEISGLREMFMDIDKDKSGSITVEEFAAALRRKGNNIPEDQVQRLVQDADIDGDGTIDYEEFLAATINQSKLERDDRLKAAFAHFDIDGNGMISRDELVQSLTQLGINERGIDDIISDVDKDGNGQIDYKEFCQMMRNL